MSDPDNTPSKQLNEHTRALYHQQHIRQGEDDVARERLMALTTEAFFEVEPGFFRDKKVLDAGCGSIIRNAIGFLKMGSADVTAMDLGDDWFGTARKNMARYSVPPDAIRLVNGNVVELPFESSSFDFVCLDGVLPHLADQAQVEAAIRELGRVTRPGGYAFISYLGGGGLIETKLHDAAREFYKESAAFRTIIDNISPATLHSMVDYVVNEVNSRNGESCDLFELKKLLDEDLCIALQNLLQAQRREHHRQDYVNGLLAKQGFGEPRRLKRYVKRKNIRKFMAPLHFNSDHPLSKLMYGDGWIDSICQKHA